MARKQKDAGEGGRDRVPYVGSALVHAAALALALWTSMSDPPVLDVVTYQIDIVSPPATAPEPVEEPPQPEEELVVEEPDPEPVVEEEEPAVVEPEPEPEEVQAEVPEEPVEAPPEEPEEPVATEESETRQSGEDIRVRMEGLERDYPEYYRNIILQIDRCFRPPAGARGLSTQVYFVIRRDGTVDVDDLDIAQESGNIRFDIAAMAAVECAGQGRFGPLPEELPYDQLPVLFNFTPRS